MFFSDPCFFLSGSISVCLELLCIKVFSGVIAAL